MGIETELPSLEEITRQLRALNERTTTVAGSAGVWVGLWVSGIVTPPYVGYHGPAEDGDVCHGREWLPGRGAGFNAPALAERLLAAAQDAAMETE